MELFVVQRSKPKKDIFTLRPKLLKSYNSSERNIAKHKTCKIRVEFVQVLFRDMPLEFIWPESWCSIITRWIIIDHYRIWWISSEMFDHHEQKHNESGIKSKRDVHCHFCHWLMSTWWKHDNIINKILLSVNRQMYKVIHSIV